MKLKIALATATALGLCMGTAWAGSNNTADIVQNNNSNSGSIDQSAGSFNRSLFKQDGNSNIATVKQTGDSNIAGRTNNTSPIYGHILQQGDHNSIDVLQTGDGNGIVNYLGERSAISSRLAIGTTPRSHNMAGTVPETMYGPFSRQAKVVRQARPTS